MSQAWYILQFRQWERSSWAILVEHCSVQVHYWLKYGFKLKLSPRLSWLGQLELGLRLSQAGSESLFYKRIGRAHWTLLSPIATQPNSRPGQLSLPNLIIIKGFFATFMGPGVDSVRLGRLEWRWKDCSCLLEGSSATLASLIPEKPLLAQLVDVVCN